jgi:pyruvate ferredoxin oxidoreductase delta subunit
MSERLYVTPIGDTGMYELDTASWREFRPVMDKSKCKECGICLTFCPVNSIVGKDDNTYAITYGFCKGCGICAVECPHKAIVMVPEGGAVDHE